MNAILAVDGLSAAYSKQNDLIFWCPKDLQHFKNMTSQGDDPTVVMGSKTWFSLPKRPLPNRRNIVLSTREIELEEADVMTLDHLQEQNHTDYWMIGGAEMLKKCIDLELIDHLYISIITPQDPSFMLSGDSYDIEVNWLFDELDDESKWDFEYINMVSDTCKKNNIDVIINFIEAKKRY